MVNKTRQFIFVEVDYVFFVVTYTMLVFNQMYVKYKQVCAQMYVYKKMKLYYTSTNITWRLWTKQRTFNVLYCPSVFCDLLQMLIIGIHNKCRTL